MNELHTEALNRMPNNEWVRLSQFSKGRSEVARDLLHYNLIEVKNTNPDSLNRSTCLYKKL